MVKSFALLLGQIYLIFLVLNNLLVVIRYRRLPVEVRTILLFLLASLLTDLSSRWLFHQKANNLYLLHIYTMLEWLSWSCFFLVIFRRRNWFTGRWPLIGVGGILVLLVLNSVFLEPMSGFNSNAKTLVQLLIVSYGIFFCFQAFGKIDLRQPVPRAISLITVATICYYSGSLFIFMFSKMLANQGVADQEQFGFWAINALLLVLLHGLIFFALCTIAFRKTSSS